MQFVFSTQKLQQRFAHLLYLKRFIIICSTFIPKDTNAVFKNDNCAKCGVQAASGGHVKWAKCHDFNQIALKDNQILSVRVLSEAEADPNVSLITDILFNIYQSNMVVIILLLYILSHSECRADSNIATQCTFHTNGKNKNSPDFGSQEDWWRGCPSQI